MPLRHHLKAEKLSGAHLVLRVWGVLQRVLICSPQKRKKTMRKHKKTQVEMVWHLNISKLLQPSHLFEKKQKRLGSASILQIRSWRSPSGPNTPLMKAFLSWCLFGVFLVVFHQNFELWWVMSSCYVSFYLTAWDFQFETSTKIMAFVETKK